eukprot:gene8192-9730_t
MAIGVTREFGEEEGQRLAGGYQLEVPLQEGQRLLLGGQVVIKKWLQEGQRLLLGGQVVMKKWLQEGQRLLLGGQLVMKKWLQEGWRLLWEERMARGLRGPGLWEELGTWLEESLWRPRWEWGRGVRETLWEARGSLRL